MTRRDPWVFATKRDVEGCGQIFLARNGSVVGRLSQLDLVRHDSWWVDDWWTSLRTDWLEKEDS